MSEPVISEQLAFEIAHFFTKDIVSQDQQGIVAVYVIGSLGGNYYRPGHSDIDTIIILKDDASITQSQIDKVSNQYWQKWNIPKGLGSIAIHESELQPPCSRSVAEDYEFSIEVARLKIQGKALYQSIDLSLVPLPSRAELVKDAKTMEIWLNREFGYPMFDKLQLVGCINSILMYMRRFLTIEKRLFEFNKFRIVNCYLNNVPPIVNLKVVPIIQDHLQDMELTDDALYSLREFGIQIRDCMNWSLLQVRF